MSSGRSMWGLCGNFDTWAGDDSYFLARNWQRLFYVTNGALDMFTHSGQRSHETEMLEFSKADLDLQAKLDKLNGVVQAEDLQANMDETLAAPPPAAATETQDELDQAKPEAVNLGLATPEMKAAARRRCKGSHGETRKQCEVDILNGLPQKDARKTFDALNIEDKQVLLKRCMLVGPNNFMVVPAKTVSKRETKAEGYSYAMWYLPTKITTSRCVVAEKGNDFFITQNGASLDIGAGKLHCTARDVLHGTKWTSVAVSLHHSGSLQVFINGKAACAAQSKAGLPKDGSKDLVVGGAAGGDSCSGRVAHLYYVPQTITEKEATTHGQLSPFACGKGTKVQAATTLIEESEMDNEDDSDLDLEDD